VDNRWDRNGDSEDSDLLLIGGMCMSVMRHTEDSEGMRPVRALPTRAGRRS